MNQIPERPNQTAEPAVVLQLRPTGHDLADLLKLPVATVAISIFLLGATLLPAGPPSGPGVWISGFLGFASLVLIGLELKDLKTATITITDTHLAFAERGRQPVAMPRKDVASVQVSDVLIARRMKPAQRVTRVDALMMLPGQFSARHPHANDYQPLNGMDERFISLAVGKSQSTRDRLDAFFRAAGLGSYRGIQVVRVMDPGGIREAMRRPRSQPSTR